MKKRLNRLQMFIALGLLVLTILTAVFPSPPKAASFSAPITGSQVEQPPNGFFQRSHLLLIKRQPAVLPDDTHHLPEKPHLVRHSFYSIDWISPGTNGNPADFILLSSSVFPLAASGIYMRC